MSIKLRKLKTGHDKFDRATIFNDIVTWLQASDKYRRHARKVGAIFDFAHLVVTVEACEGFTFPSIDAEPAALAKAFVKWGELDAEVTEAHQQAIEAAEKPTNAPALAPADADAEKN